MELTNGKGVDLIVDVDFGANQDQNLSVIKEGGVISAYASVSDMTPTLQFYGFMFKNVTLRMLIAYLIPDDARRKGEADIYRWLENGDLTHAIVDGGNLEQLANAHNMVAAGQKLGTVVVSV